MEAEAGKKLTQEEEEEEVAVVEEEEKNQDEIQMSHWIPIRD